MSDSKSNPWRVFKVKDDGDLSVSCEFMAYKEAAEYARRQASCNGNLSLMRHNEQGILVYWQNATNKDAGHYVYLEEETGDEIKKSYLYKRMRDIMKENGNGRQD